MFTEPLVTGTMARFGIVSPFVKFRLLTAGRTAWPPGNTERKLGAVGFVTVTLRTMDETLDGTPARLATCRFSVWLGWTLATGAPVPLRVSSSRDGETGVKLPPPLGVS